jgi:tRNA-specific 2-thiouridylase
MKGNKSMRKKAIVAMSGGLDSSIAAYLLKSQGYEVCGVTMQLCEEKDHADKARKIAEQLDIEHQVIDLKNRFKTDVIDYFSGEYLIGHTPNPCLACNRLIKFGSLMDLALKQDAYFATGHYARVEYDQNNDIYQIRKAKDKSKDQSYVLFMLDQQKLKRLLLPLADKTKSQIKDMAGDLGLPISAGQESQDICFIPDKDYVGFIRKNIKGFEPVPGDIIDKQGKVLGRHKGIVYYTIGQRKGLGIAHTQPLFVTSIDTQKNTIIVGPEEQLYSRSLVIDKAYFAHPDLKQQEFTCLVKIRYHHNPAEALITRRSKDSYQVDFKQKQKSITIGQGAVFYDNDKVIGGGMISSVFD